MDLAVRSGLAIVRASQAAAAPSAPVASTRPAIIGVLAPGLQVAAVADPDTVQGDRRHRPDVEADRIAPLQPAAPLADAPAHRYRYKIAHAPDLDRPLLQIVDEKTDQIMVSLPPEQLVRMLEDAKALVEDRRDSHAKNVDTTV